MKNIAVILTVFNRKVITLKGLRSLYKAIEMLGEAYSFDIYMTDDGSSDGTGEAVAKEFPEIRIVEGNGKLFWSGGMRKAWQAAVDSGKAYDFFLWFNDDVELYEDALVTIFESYRTCGTDCLVTGAFHDCQGNPSYGGRTKGGTTLEPDGSCQEVTLMNGNLVLIPNAAFCKLGMIDKAFIHSVGDYDYGLRARESGYGIRLTAKYVGVCDRHDVERPRYFNPEVGLKTRWKSCYSPQNSPFSYCAFLSRHEGVWKAFRYFLWINFYTLFPGFYKKKGGNPIV